MIEFIVFISLGIIVISIAWKAKLISTFPWLIRKRQLVISKLLLVVFTVGISNFYGYYTLENTATELVEKESNEASSDSNVDLEDLSEEADKVVLDQAYFFQFINETMNGFIFNDMPFSSYCTSIVIPPPELLFKIHRGNS